MYVKWAPAEMQVDSCTLRVGPQQGFRGTVGHWKLGLHQGYRWTVGHRELDSSRVAGGQWDTGSWTLAGMQGDSGTLGAGLPDSPSLPS